MQLFVSLMSQSLNKHMTYETHTPFLHHLRITFFLQKNASNEQLFSQCSSEDLLDSAAIAHNILGDWTLVKQRLGRGKVVLADKKIKAIFNADSTYRVLENSSILTEGNWRLKKVLDNRWGLDCSTQNNYLNGFISFCNNQVSFNFGYLDGSDNLFVKSNE